MTDLLDTELNNIDWDEVMDIVSVVLENSKYDYSNRPRAPTYSLSSYRMLGDISLVENIE